MRGGVKAVCNRNEYYPNGVVSCADEGSALFFGSKAKQSVARKQSTAVEAIVVESRSLAPLLSLADTCDSRIWHGMVRVTDATRHSCRASTRVSSSS